MKKAGVPWERRLSLSATADVDTVAEVRLLLFPGAAQRHRLRRGCAVVSDAQFGGEGGCGGWFECDIDGATGSGRECWAAGAQRFEVGWVSSSERNRCQIERSRALVGQRHCLRRRSSAVRGGWEDDAGGAQLHRGCCCSCSAERDCLRRPSRSVRDG